jgi:hypothetical protein
MAKELVIPPIKGNPRIGKETENDASVRYGGAKLYHKTEAVIAKEKTPRKKRVAKRKTKQKTFTISNLEILKKLSERLGMPQASILNLGLAKVEQEFSSFLK